jgi:hypothetical protein
VKTKTFDCVEMKQRGQEALLAKLDAMTSEEQQEFWRQQNQALREWQKELLAQRQDTETTAA